MQQEMSRKKKILCLTAAILISLLWLCYQILLWQRCYGRYNNFSNTLVRFIDVPLRYYDSEARRFSGVMVYLQTLPHVLLAYCLFIKWPGKKNALRIAAAALMFCISLLAVPQTALSVFRGYSNISAQSVPNGYLFIFAHGLLALLGVLVFAAAGLGGSIKSKGRSLLRPKAVASAALRLLLTAVISFLIALCYGFVLSVLNRFNPSAVNYVLNTFSPDARLISGIIISTVMAPIVEEMAFRGIIMQKTRQFSSAWFAVVFSSVVFGLWHRNLGQFFATTVMGIIFACVYLKSGKLIHAMLAHSLSNLFLVMAATSVKGYLPYIEGLTELRHSLLEASLPVGIIGLLASLALIFFLIFKGYPLLTERHCRFHDSVNADLKCQ